MMMMMLNLFKKLPCILEKGLNVLRKNNFIRNQIDKKNTFPQILPQKKLIQKYKN